MRCGNGNATEFDGGTVVVPTMTSSFDVRTAFVGCLRCRSVELEACVTAVVDDVIEMLLMLLQVLFDFTSETCCSADNKQTYNKGFWYLSLQSINQINTMLTHLAAQHSTASFFLR